MLITNITHGHGEHFAGEYRISYPLLRFTKYGYPFIAFELCDMTGSLMSYLWLDRDDDPPTLTDRERVSVCAKLRFFNGKWIANILSIEAVSECASHPITLIPSRNCPLSDLMPRLSDVAMSLENKPLYSFITKVFGDDSIAFPFVVSPASSSHHHGYAGGLLEHSLECAEIVSQMSLFSRENRELGVVAALLHDIGKIKTLTDGIRLSSTGIVLNHDALTLEILGPHLKSLDYEWADGGIALRYLLTWKSHHRGSFPLMTIAEAVSAADRISTGINREADAFSTLPPWRNATKSLYQNGFWRPTSYREASEKCVSLKQ